MASAQFIALFCAGGVLLLPLLEEKRQDPAINSRNNLA